jgi:hypothetical protein
MHAAGRADNFASGPSNQPNTSTRTLVGFGELLSS